jgi:hypothetical protein
MQYQQADESYVIEGRRTTRPTWTPAGSLLLGILNRPEG